MVRLIVKGETGAEWEEWAEWEASFMRRELRAAVEAVAEELGLLDEPPYVGVYYHQDPDNPRDPGKFVVEMGSCADCSDVVTIAESPLDSDAWAIYLDLSRPSVYGVGWVLGTWGDVVAEVQRVARDLIELWRESDDRVRFSE